MNDLKISPAKKYDAPKYPAYADTKNNPLLLNKLPSRWRKNAAVIACIGLVGTFALTGCAKGTPNIDGGEPDTIIIEQYTRAVGSALNLTVRTHNGGDGGGPVYVAYLTEWEALSIIRAEAEAAGLRLNDTPPDYKADADGIIVGLDLFDENKQVALAYVNPEDTGRWGWEYDAKNLAVAAERELRQKYEDIKFGVFYVTGETVGWGRPSWADEDWAAGQQWSEKEVTEENKAEAGKNIEENLKAQVQQFIRSLQRQGILDVGDGVPDVPKENQEETENDE